MPALCQSILTQLPGGNPYLGFDASLHSVDLTGGADWAFTEAVLEKTRPRLVVEVGTWKGATALRIADWMRRNNIDGAVICVDTWLGGLEHLEGTVSGDWMLTPYIRHGWPRLQEVFLTNVVKHGLQDWVAPLATTSTIGAKWVRRRGLRPDAILIDGSHDEEDVLQDLRSWWQVPRLGGLIFGDDWSASWPGVITAVRRFAAEKGLTPTVEGVSWLLEKGPSEETLEWLAPLLERLKP